MSKNWILTFCLEGTMSKRRQQARSSNNALKFSGENYSITDKYRQFFDA
jgi:hypothetical protein